MTMYLYIADINLFPNFAFGKVKRRFSIITDDYALSFDIEVKSGKKPEKAYLMKRLKNWIHDDKLDEICEEIRGWFNEIEMSVSNLARQLPGMDQKEIHPVTKSNDILFFIIQDLNDNHKWTREEIADWIETLDNVPVFPVPSDKKEESNGKGSLVKITGLVKIKRILPS